MLSYLGNQLTNAAEAEQTDTIYQVSKLKYDRCLLISLEIVIIVSK